MRGNWRGAALGLVAALLAPRAAVAGPGWEASAIAPYGTQPGVRGGLTFALTEGERTRLTLNPHVGAYARAGNHTAVLTDVTLGVDRTTASGRTRWGAELGVGYLLRRQRLSADIDLATGDKTWTHTLRHAALPTLALSAGGTGADRPALFGRLSVGRTLSVDPAGAGFVMVELGLRGAAQGGR